MRSVLDSVVTPSRWELVPFGRLVERSRQAGRPDLPPLSVFLDEGVVPRSSRTDNYNRLGSNLAKYLVVRPGDVVFNKLRTWQGGLGVSRYKGIVSPAYFVCRPLPRVNSRYLHYLLRSTPYLAELTRVSKFMPPSQFDILWDDLRLLPILVPKTAVQAAIADYLDTETGRIDALITKKRRMIKLLEERRALVTLAGVSGGLVRRFPRVRSAIPWMTRIPRHWGSPKVGYVASLGSGHTPSRSKPEWWIPEECTIPWITTGEVARLRTDRVEFVHQTRERISQIGLANSAAVVHPAGTVFLCRTASAGYSGIMASDMATSQDFATWRCGPGLEPRFLLLCLRAMRPDLLGRLAMGSTHQTIYMPDIRGLTIPLPPLEEQRGIVFAVWNNSKPSEERRIVSAIKLPSSNNVGGL